MSNEQEVPLIHWLLIGFGGMPWPRGVLKAGDMLAATARVS
ncbi:hypothetical protein ABFP37_18690 [Burkholderia sp. RS01]